MGDFEECHAQFEECAVKQTSLFRGEIALGLVHEDAEHVDALTGAEDVDLRLLAFVGCGSELHHGGHVDGLHELLEAHRGRMIHAGVGGANGGVEPVCCHLVGAAGLIIFFRGGRRRQFGFCWLFGRRGSGLRLGGLRRFGGGWGGCGFVLFSFRGGICVGAKLAVHGKFAAIGDDEGFGLLRHGYTLSFRCRLRR